MTRLIRSYPDHMCLEAYNAVKSTQWPDDAVYTGAAMHLAGTQADDETIEEVSRQVRRAVDKIHG